jgi:hypothetical protein
MLLFKAFLKLFRNALNRLMICETFSAEDHRKQVHRFSKIIENRFTDCPRSSKTSSQIFPSSSKTGSHIVTLRIHDKCYYQFTTRAISAAETALPSQAWSIQKQLFATPRLQRRIWQKHILLCKRSAQLSALTHALLRKPQIARLGPAGPTVGRSRQAGNSR